MQGVVFEGTPKREQAKQERVETGSARPALYMISVFFFTICLPFKDTFSVFCHLYMYCRLKKKKCFCAETHKLVLLRPKERSPW